MITKIKSNLRIRNILIILSFLLLSVFCFSLFIGTHRFLNEGDIPFHLGRILELKSDILHGNFLPMFSFNEFHGSAVMTLYPYLNLYPIALLFIFIRSKIIALYLWYIISLFILFLVSFYSSYKVNKSIFISYLFSIIYGTSSMCFNSGFSGGLHDFGELTAYAFLPLILFGCINWIKHDKYMELTIGLILIIYSHILTAIMAIMFIGLWIIFNLLRLNRKKIISLVKSAILTALLTSVIWLPALDLKLGHTSISTPASPRYASFYGVNSNSLVSLIKPDLELFDLTLPNIFALLGIILVIFFYKYLTHTQMKLFWISLIFTLLGSNNFPWRYMPHSIMKLVGVFQVPQRFFILSQLLLGYLFAVALIKFIGSKQLTKLNKIETLSLSGILIIINLFKGLRAHQSIYLGMFLILAIVTLVSIACIRCNKHKLVKIILFSGALILALMVQLYTQKQDVQLHQQGSLLTRTFYNSHIRGHFRNTWRDSISKTSQMKYLLNQWTMAGTEDYYPQISLNKLNLINHNKGFYGKNKQLNVNHVGYNTFSFKNNRNINALTLPVLHYGNEHLHIYLNNHLNHYKVGKDSLITLNNVKKGNHKLYIQPYSNVWLIGFKSLLSLIGVAWLIIYIRKYFKLNHII